MDFSPAVLRNKGVPILLNVVAMGEHGWQVLRDEAGEPRIEEVNLRLTANEVADLEDLYDGYSCVEDLPIMGDSDQEELDEEGRPTGRKVQVVVATHQEKRTYNGLAGFQRATVYQPVKTARQVIALCLHRPVEQVGAGMIADEREYYESAVAGAWAIANGMVPDAVGKALAESRKEASAQLERVRAELQKEMDAALTPPSDTPGASGSVSGPEVLTPEGSGEVLPSSGS